MNQFEEYILREMGNFRWEEVYFIIWIEWGAEIIDLRAKIFLKKKKEKKKIREDD